MSDIYGTTSTPEGADRELGAVDVSTTSGTDTYGTDSHGTDSLIGTTPASSVSGTSGSSSTKEVAADEARATGQQAKEGAKHVAEVGKDEAKNVVQETGQQAKELWQQTRSQLMDQSAQQQSRVAEGLRSLSQELSGMARSSEQQGVASDLAHQASQRIGDVAGWLDQRDPGSLVTELKQFARQRPGTFLATAAVLGLVGGRLSRGIVAEHQDSSDGMNGSGSASPTGMDHSTAGYSAYGSPAGTTAPAATSPVSTTTGTFPVDDPVISATGPQGDLGPVPTDVPTTSETLR